MTRSVRLLFAITGAAVGILLLTSVTRHAIGLPSYPVKLDVWADDWRLAGLHLTGHALVATGRLALAALLLYIGWAGRADAAPSFTFPIILGLLASLFVFSAVNSVASIVSLWVSLPWGQGVLYVLTGALAWALWVALFLQRRRIMRILEAFGEVLAGDK